MNIGFTGTRQGMSENQKKSLKGIIERLDNENESIDEFHHGGCIGADNEASNIIGAGRCICSFIPIITHHPKNERYVVYKYGDYPPFLESFVQKPKPYLERNRDIVDNSDILIACPKDFNQTRSGTWYTINYAHKQGKPVIILW